MSSSHEERMRAIGSVAIPPRGTQARELLDKILTKHDTPEQRKIIKKLWEKSQAIIAGQQLNGAVYEADQALRWFQWEYNNRIWNHGLNALPSTFDVVEAFLQYNPKLNTFILHEENNHLFSFSAFVNWYTSGDIDLDQKVALEAFTPGVIYSFDNLADPSDLLYGIERNSEVGISGLAMVRFGAEISVLCVAGETENLEKKTGEIKESLQKVQYAESRKYLVPDPSLSIEAVPLKSKIPLWRLIALSRFDLSEMSQSVRYICHDAGYAYQIITDDPNAFLDMKGDFVGKDVKAVALNSAREITGYNALFNLCSTALFLPLYFEKFAEDVTIERFKTRYASEAGKASFLKTKENIPQSIKVAYRNINIIRAEEKFSDTRATIYSIPNFHVQTSGYWRTLEPGKIGSDKNGNPIHGRTWISKKLSWMEAEEPNALVAKRNDKKVLPKGPAPGFIYVMRSPLHPRNIFKVGLTQSSTETRVNELSSATGVPGRIYVMQEWAVGDCVSIEREIHSRLAEYRVDPRREFFEAPLEHIMSVIEETILSMG
jgi:T5orf172 domain.